jgi:hypothetical protein
LFLLLRLCCSRVGGGIGIGGGEGGEALEESRVFLFESVECSLAEIRPFLSRIRAQREYAYARRDVSSCADFSAELEQRLLQLLDLLSVLSRRFFLLIQRL